MKIFIFEDLDQATYSYHTEGSIAVVARDRSHVEELVAQDKEIQLEWEKLKAEYELTGEPEAKIFVFPDSGCC